MAVYNETEQYTTGNFRYDGGQTFTSSHTDLAGLLDSHALAYGAVSTNTAGLTDSVVVLVSTAHTGSHTDLSGLTDTVVAVQTTPREFTEFSGLADSRTSVQASTRTVTAFITRQESG